MTTTNDERIGMAEAARSFGALGRNGKPIAPETVCRWHRKGILLPDGTRLRLKAECVGVKLATRPSWLREFSEALAAARGSSEPAIRTPAARLRDSEAALDELKRGHVNPTPSNN